MALPWQLDKKDVVASPWDLQPLFFIFLFSSISLLTTRTAYADNVSTLLENCPPQTMQSISEQSDRAMGLVKAAHSSWKHSEGSDEEATELRQEFEARLAELATHGFQAVEHAGSLVFARAPVEDGEYTADCLVYPRDPGSTLASTPVPLSSLTRVYSCDPALLRDGCCATKKLRGAALEIILCGSTCDEGTNFCTVHSMFMTTNPTRMILPKECLGFRFGVGHAEFGLKFFKPLSDSHLDQHFSMLGMVPTDVCYMTKVTSHNHGSPQIARVLRDREDQADMEGGQQSGTVACTLDRVKTVQDLVSIYEIAGKSAATSNLSVPFEQVSGEAQFGGALPRNEPTVGGGGPAAISQAGSQPVVGTVAHNPTTHPFGPNQVQEFTAAQAALDGLTARRVQMVLDIESCSLLLHSKAPAEVSGAVEGMRLVRLRVPVWQRKVEQILVAAYSFLPSLLTRANQRKTANAVPLPLSHERTSCSVHDEGRSIRQLPSDIQRSKGAS